MNKLNFLESSFLYSRLTLFKIAVTSTVNESTDYWPAEGSVDRQNVTPEMNDRIDINKMNTLEVETLITQRPKNSVCTAQVPLLRFRSKG